MKADQGEVGGMGESPPPTVIQLREVLNGLAASLVYARQADRPEPLTDSEVYALGIARGLTENLITAYPALTLAADGTPWVEPVSTTVDTP